MSVVVALVFGLAATLALAGGGGPEVITIPAKKGTVTFHHWKHQQRAKNCGVCHHYKGPDGKRVIDEKGEHAQKCDTCHNKSFPNKHYNKPMKVFHKRCKGCHKKNHVAHGTSCHFCHKKK